mmetsp:Transcript_5536/g.4217  ORF Transcript_5536/g.4217 Transcript_5536/m.4217 type:complete len:122 (+) Transcript_5536:634-999(+)
MMLQKDMIAIFKVLYVLMNTALEKFNLLDPDLQKYLISKFKTFNSYTRLLNSRMKSLSKKVRRGVKFEVPQFFEVSADLIEDIEVSLANGEKVHLNTIEYVQQIMNIRVLIDQDNSEMRPI